MTAPAATAPIVQTFLDLCAIRSESHHEQDAAAYVRAYLERLGLTVHEDDAGAAIPAGCGNLYTRIAPTTSGTPIFLCAHLDTVTLEDDVVPVLRDDGRIENERRAILGGDNKAAVAVLLELARELVEQDTPHAGLELVLTPCEEVGLLGAKHFDVSRFDAAFGYVFDHAEAIGRIVTSAPTQITIRAAFHGKSSHAGIAPEEGRSAIQAAALAIARMQLGRIDARTTANVGLIDGGTAGNVVPEHCTVHAEARSLDHERASQHAATMVDAIVDAAAHFNVDVEVESHEEYRAYSFKDTAPVVALARTALAAAGYTPEGVAVGGGADAHAFNAHGKPCANLCNAMHDIHTPDEHYYAADLEGMLRVSRELLAAARA